MTGFWKINHFVAGEKNKTITSSCYHTSSNAGIMISQRIFVNYHTECLLQLVCIDFCSAMICFNDTSLAVKCNDIVDFLKVLLRDDCCYTILAPATTSYH